MKLTCEERGEAGDGKVLTVKIVGEMTIRHGDEIRIALREALHGADRVTLDIEGVNSIDLAGLQLICSARHTAAARHKEMEVSGAGNDAYRNTMRDAGFPCLVGCIRDAAKIPVTGGDAND